MSEEKFLDLEYQQTKFLRYIDSLEPESKTKTLKALNVAEEAHWSQFRHEGSPYIVHPIRTALILVEELGIDDINLLCAALLHDVMEDGGVGVERLENLFGLEIAKIVKEVTRIKPSSETEEEKRVNKRKKIEEIAEADERVRIIKLCDILDNTRSQQYLSEDALAYQNIPRWREELALFMPIAQKTNQKLFELLSEYQ